MGSWGVKATESDYGLDLLSIIEKRYLQEKKFKLFNVNEIMELLKSFIVDEIKQSNRGCSKSDMEFYIQETFPYRYDHAVILIAECLSDFFHDGKLIIKIYEAERDRPRRRTIKNFIYTADDLKVILADLKNILDPNDDLYDTWSDSQYLDEWKAHVESLCACLETQIK